MSHPTSSTKSAEALPELPKPTHLTTDLALENKMYTADQMRAYAQACILADRTARAAAPVQSVGEDVALTKYSFSSFVGCYEDEEGEWCKVAGALAYIGARSFEQPDALGWVPSDAFHMPMMCLIEDYMSACDFHGSQTGEKCEAAEANIRAALIALAARPSAAPKIKDHVLAAVVNDLRDTAIRFHQAGQLRERLRGCLGPLLGGIEPATPAPAEPVSPVGAVDWLGLALELERLTDRIESQTVERAMIAAAHGLRLIGATPTAVTAPDMSALGSEAMEAVYPRSTSVHGSIQMRNHDDRTAFSRGWQAAIRALHSQPKGGE